MHKYKQLLVWQKSRTLTKEVYSISKDFPRVEDFNLTSQIRRASTSIMLNISEGAGRFSNPDFARFLTIASGSANEVGCASVIAFDQGYIAESTLNSLENQVEEILKMLFKLRKSLLKTS
jgi:four helix bundle protein